MNEGVKLGAEIFCFAQMERTELELIGFCSHSDSHGHDLVLASRERLFCFAHDAVSPSPLRNYPICCYYAEAAARGKHVAIVS